MFKAPGLCPSCPFAALRSNSPRNISGKVKPPQEGLCAARPLPSSFPKYSGARGRASQTPDPAWKKGAPKSAHSIFSPVWLSVIFPAGQDHLSPLARTPASWASTLLGDFGHNAGANSTATFADRKTQTLIHCNRCNQGHRHRNIVTRHNHLGA